VTLFNTSDPIVPSWNEAVYQSKVAEAGSTGFLVAQMGSATFGHCEFSLQEVLTAFGALVQAVTGEPLAVAQGRG
jgi:hypothetical protein